MHASLQIIIPYNEQTIEISIFSMETFEDVSFYLFSFFQYLSEQSPMKNKEKPPNRADVVDLPHQLISSSGASVF